MKYPTVYIITNMRNGKLYTGVTSNLAKRIWMYKEKLIKGFSMKYGLHQLVYNELFDDMYHAIKREKRLKKWNRKWKIKIINEVNPNWDDLFDTLF